MLEPHRLIFNKDQLRNEGKQHTNHLMSASSFPGPEKLGGWRKPLQFPLMQAKHGKTPREFWMESIALVTEFSLFLYYQGLDIQLQTITMKSYWLMVSRLLHDGALIERDNLRV